MYYQFLLLTFADLPVRDWFAGVPVVSLAAVVAVATGGCVSTVEANTARDPTRHLEELHVEPTAPCVLIAVALCK